MKLQKAKRLAEKQRYDNNKQKSTAKVIHRGNRVYEVHQTITNKRTGKIEQCIHDDCILAGYDSFMMGV